MEDRKINQSKQIYNMRCEKRVSKANLSLTHQGRGPSWVSEQKNQKSISRQDPARKVVSNNAIYHRDPLIFTGFSDLTPPF